MSNLESLTILSKKDVGNWRRVLSEIWGWFDITYGRPGKYGSIDVDIKISKSATNMEMDCENAESRNVQSVRDDFALLQVRMARFGGRQFVDLLMSQEAHDNGESFREEFGVISWGLGTCYSK
jgi:hypothetical protein